MRLRPIAICAMVLAVISVSLISQRSLGQSSAARSLITAPIDESKLTVLKGNTHPLARAQYDQGPASASLPMDRMLLVLKSSTEQAAALQTLLAQQTDKASTNYHKWLTPQQFGEQFGVSDDDVQKITTWLESRGFQSIKVANGRNTIEFSGTAGQVQDAFHTPIHNYMVNGQQHFANSSDPSIPQALTPAIAGVLSLHNFGRKRLSHFSGTFRKSPDTGKAEPINPQYTFVGGCFGSGTDCYALGPTDFATIYNVTSLWNAGITGSGVKIAIVSDSNINISDVNDFRSLFGLPSNPPVVTVNGANPGVLPCANNGDECEAIIDVEWSGAVAKNATIDLVVSGSKTGATFGGDLSAEYIIDNKFAPILSYSYGLCELGLGTAGNAFYGGSPTSKDSTGEWAQAAAEGITVIVATGDNGSAACDSDATGVTTEQPAQFGLAVNGVASTPYNVAVGGTDFNQLANPATFWNSTNASGTNSSAKGYIPETTWNDSCTNAFLGVYFQGFSTNAEANCNNLTSTTFTQLIAPVGGSGGASNCTTYNGTNPAACTGGYAKPSWQTGTGVPADGKRDIPDVSLFAGDGFAGSFYAVCEADLASGQACTLNNFAGFGGTSVSTQVFAGMVALINQKSQESQGNLNTVLYPLAGQQVASSCNTSAPAGGCVFYDVTVGTNAQPCVFGTPNCSRTNSADANGILTGFSAGTGFDNATGLGTINAANLINSFASLFALTSTSPTVTVAAPGNSGTMTATVTAQGSFSGTVTFACTGLPTGATCSFNPPSATLSSTATTATTTLTVSTTAPSALAPTQRQQPAAPEPRIIAIASALLCMLAIVIFASRTQNRRLRSGTAFALLIVGMAGLMLMASCGGTSGGGGGGGGTSGGTPTGSTTATVTGTSGNATGTLSFTLDVQ
ncbi:MAG TPA: S53 family peptidase [Candidatus Acidoferrales bacterium]|jgi:subtilase family serine protease|nr:S53 family peptidase [Candidatus Acidoferrales bacterium]